MNLLPQGSADSVLAAIGHKTAQAGGATTLIGWATSTEGAALLGIVGMLIGLAMQFYYNRRRDKREQAEHERRMGLMK